MLLGLFTFGVVPVSDPYPGGCGCGIRTRFSQLILGILTKINGELWTDSMISLIKTKELGNRRK